MVTRIYVSSTVLQDNALQRKVDPPITVETAAGRRQAHHVDIIVEGKVVAAVRYKYDAGMSSNVWVEVPDGVAVEPILDSERALGR